MNFLMISNCGEGAHILKMIENEGNKVQLYIKDPGYRSLWDGLLPKAKKIAPSKDTTVIFDFSGMGNIADELKKSGIPVVGGSKFADKMEQDRQFGFDLMQKYGIKVPLTVEFTDFSDVADFIKENAIDEENDRERRFVFKPSGKDLPTHLTYCSIDNEDLLEYVDYVERNYKAKIDSFVLQEFICGVDVSSEMWCDGTKFIRPANHTIEVKGFMNNNKGPATGCSGNILWIDEERCRIVENGVARVEEAIVQAGHVGPIDLNAVVNDEGVWGLEWTPRFGYDATPTQMFLFKNDIGKFFYDIARGPLTYDMPMSDKIAAGVRFSIPPYPTDPKKVAEVQKIRPNLGTPIRGLTEKNAGSIYFYEIMEVDGALQHSDGFGLIGCAMGVGDDVWSAFDRPYDVLSELKIPELQYRTDLRDVIGDMYWRAEHQDNVSTSLGILPEIEVASGD